jgi:hypothetical protein
MPSYTRFPSRYAATFQGLGLNPRFDQKKAVEDVRRRVGDRSSGTSTVVATAPIVTTTSSFKNTSIVGQMRSGISDTVGSGLVRERARTLPMLDTTAFVAASVPEYVKADPRFKAALASFDSAQKELIALQVMSLKPIKGRMLAPSDLPYPVLGSVDASEVARFIMSFATQETSVERLTSFAASSMEDKNGRLAAWIILRLPLYQGWAWRRAIASNPSDFSYQFTQNVLNNASTDPGYLSSFAMKDAPSGTSDKSVAESLGQVSVFAALWAKRYGIDAQRKMLDNRVAAVRAAEKAMKSAADVVVAEAKAVDAANMASQEKLNRQAIEAQQKLTDAENKQKELELKLTKLEENKSIAEDTIEAGGFVLSKGVVIGAVAAVAIGGFLLYRKMAR